MRKQLTESDWKRIGNQAKKARSELFMLHACSAGYIPLEIVRFINKSIDSLDKYISKAEDKMLQTGVSDDLTIFYGPDRN